MAPGPVYANQGPFTLLESPLFRARKEDPKFKLEDDEIMFTASEMCSVHNLIVRGLNSIYLQAPHIQPADQKDFCGYIQLWCLLINTHHREEEAYFFPWVEELTGIKGLMEGNVKQHEAFHSGLEKFSEYVEAVLAGKDKYDGQRVVKLIDDFGKVLTEHLNDEIPTLLGLSEYRHVFVGENGLRKKMDSLGKEVMGSISLGNLAVMFTNVDTEYEGGLWKQWPPVPGLIRWILRYIMHPLNRNLARFGSCDKYGRLKPLHAIPFEESQYGLY